MKILSLDGGGVRGLYTLHVLKTLERRLDIKIHEHFDMFVGTSTGGILALAYAAGNTTDDLISFYNKEIPKIFTPDLKHRLLSGFGLWDEKYDNKQLRKALEKYLGDKLVSKLPKIAVVTAVNVSANVPEIIGPGSVLKAVEAALATSAAPTYFEPLSRAGEALCDGGLLANNPSTIAVSVAMQLKGRDIIDQIRLLSVGTSYHQDGIPAEKATTMGVLAWAGPISSTMMSTQSKFYHDLTKSVLTEKYLRINSELSHAIKLDSLNPQDHKTLKEAGEKAATDIKIEDLEFLLHD